MRNILLLCSAFLLSCTYTSGGELNNWVAFLESPSPENEKQLMDAIGGDLKNCGWGKPENQVAIPDRFRRSLFDLIADGNTPSYRVGLQVEKCLDGGDLGDFRRSAGLFLDNRPGVFVAESRRFGISQERFAELVTRLPLVLTDDPKSQEELMNDRINTLEELQILAEVQMSEKALNELRELKQSVSEVVEDQN